MEVFSISILFTLTPIVPDWSFSYSSYAIQSINWNVQTSEIYADRGRLEKFTDQIFNQIMPLLYSKHRDTLFQRHFQVNLSQSNNPWYPVSMCLKPERSHGRATTFHILFDTTLPSLTGISNFQLSRHQEATHLLNMTSRMTTWDWIIVILMPIMVSAWWTRRSDIDWFTNILVHCQLATTYTELK